MAGTFDRPEDIRAKYEDIVKRPGKFEGGKAFKPYFYEAWLDGMSELETERYGRTVSVFSVSTADKLIFSELSGFRWVCLWQDDNGFVYCIPTNDPKCLESEEGDES